MPNARPALPPEVSEFANAAKAMAEERYANNYQRGFAHMAFQVAFPTFSFTDDQADEIISIDRKGDLGCDGLYIDDDEQQVLLFQSKSSGALTDAPLHEAISTFLGVPTKLQSDAWVEKAHSDMLALSNDYREAISKGYKTLYSFATASEVSPRIRETFDNVGTVPGTDLPAALELLGGDLLESRYRKIMLGEYGRSTDVVFSGRKNQLHKPTSAVEVIYLTICAKDYVDSCKNYGTELFRFNPRLYLGSNTVNKSIAASLGRELERKYFHLLNNGVTAVCKSFDLVDAGDENWVLRVVDFQVVNGCQSTQTLIDNSAKFADDKECLIDVKIIQAEGLRDRISTTTNTQTAIVVEDSFANDPDQQRIGDALKRHSPSYFYAPKRGLWEKGTSVLKKNFAMAATESRIGRHRRLTSKELAADCLAAFGEPEAAKDRPRQVFERLPNGETSAFYQRIFGVNNVAAQWLLPFELRRHANAMVKDAGDDARKAAEAAAGKSDDSKEGRAARTAETRARVGEYGRYRLVHLAYRLLKDSEGEQNDFLSPLSSATYLESLGQWAEPVLQMALDALVDSYDDARERDQTTGLREYFREKRHQTFIFNTFEKVRDRRSREAERSQKDLDQYLGFAA